jgi:magnesium chelatase family protein
MAGDANRNSGYLRIWRVRLAGTHTSANARMTQARLHRFCPVDPALARLLQQAIKRLHLSARAHVRLLKVARTIAAST